MFGKFIADLQTTTISAEFDLIDSCSVAQRSSPCKSTGRTQCRYYNHKCDLWSCGVMMLLGSDMQVPTVQNIEVVFVDRVCPQSARRSVFHDFNGVR